MPLLSKFYNLLPRLRPQVFQAAEDEATALLTLPDSPIVLSAQNQDSARLAAVASSEIARM